MRLDEGWNQIQFNLSDFTRRAYGTNYIETLRVQIHANCRIRRCATGQERVLWPGRAGGAGGRAGADNHATCPRVAAHRIYFSDRLYTEEELPPEFKLFLPVQEKAGAAAAAQAAQQQQQAPAEQ